MPLVLSPASIDAIIAGFEIAFMVFVVFCFVQILFIIIGE